LYYLAYILLCTATLSYGWGCLSKSRWYDDDESSSHDATCQTSICSTTL